MEIQRFPNPPEWTWLSDVDFPILLQHWLSRTSGFYVQWRSTLFQLLATVRTWILWFFFLNQYSRREKKPCYKLVFLRKFLPWTTIIGMNWRSKRAMSRRRPQQIAPQVKCWLIMCLDRGCEETVPSIPVADPLLVLQRYRFYQNGIKRWWVIANGQNGCGRSRVRTICAGTCGESAIHHPDNIQCCSYMLFYTWPLPSCPLWVFPEVPGESFSSRQESIF